MRLSKRKLIGLVSGALGWSGISTAMAALQPTAPQTEGPFYPREQDLFSDRDNDLVKIADKVKQAGGEILHLTGVVKDVSGLVLPGARIEIWQCDANGRYLHGSDWSLTRSRDAAFQGFGATFSDGEGRFSFRTIKPVSYPGRTPHIHAKVFHPESGKVLTTQFYLAGDPRNDRDGLFRRLSEAEQNSVSMRLVSDQQGEWSTELVVVI